MHYAHGAGDLPAARAAHDDFSQTDQVQICSFLMELTAGKARNVGSEQIRLLVKKQGASQVAGVPSLFFC